MLPAPNSETSTPEQALPVAASHDGRDRDAGVVLVLTLLLTVVLAVVVLALATYAATGLRSSRVTTERTESNATTSAAVSWVLEELSAKRLTPDAACSSSGASVPVPPGVYGDVPGLEVRCFEQAEIDGHPTVLVSASLDDTRDLDVVVQVPLVEYGVQVYSWTAS